MALASTFTAFDAPRDWRSIRGALNPGDAAARTQALDLANDLRVAAARREATILLPIDQFEELLGRDTDASADLLLRWLATVLSDDGGPFLALATLRSDFLGAYQTHEALAGLASEPIALPQMTVADFAQVIEGPARVAGIDLESGLVQAMVADTATDYALPLLAFALRELWDRCGTDGRLTLAEYQSLGGLQGALARAAEAIYTDRTLSEMQEAGLRKAFLSMVRIDEEGRYVRRPVRWRELPPDVLNLLERYVKARLLVSRGEGAERILEVAHEALFRSWDRLVTWLNADREFLLWRERLRAAIEEWSRTGQDVGAVLRGAALAEAERWLAERASDLAANELDYIATGTALRKREEQAETAQRNREIAQVRALAAEADARRKAESERAEEAKRSEQRVRRFSVFLLAFLLVAIASASVAFFQMDRAKYEARRSRSNELAAAALYNLRNDPERSVLLALAAASETSADDVVMAAAEDALHRAVQASRVRLTLAGHGGAVHDVVYSPDGKRLATVSEDSKAKVWDAASGRELLTLSGHSQALWGVAFSADGGRLATAGEDRKARVWDVASGRELTVVSGTSEAAAVAFSPDGTRLAVGYADGIVRVWDIASRQRLLELAGHSGAVRALSFSPDGMRLASASQDATAKIWDAVSGKKLRDLAGHRAEVRGVSFSPDGMRLATASSDHTTKIWEIASGRQVITLADANAVFRVAYSPDGRRLATALADRTAKVWDAVSGKEWLTLSGHTDIVVGVAFSPDGTRLASASVDKTAKVWELRAPGELATFAGHAAAVWEVAFSPDGTRLATASKDRTARVWDAGSGKPLLSISGHTGEVKAVAYSPDGSRLATASLDGTARVWDASSGRQLMSLDGHLAEVWGIAFSPDGKRLATASWDKTARVWDASTGKELFTLTCPNTALRLAFSPDGTRLATVSLDQIEVWDISSGKELFRTPAGPNAVLGIAYSPDGRRLATAMQDGGSIVRDATSGTELLALSGHRGQVLGVTFSGDGKRLATASEDGTARVWDATSGKELLVLSGHEGQVTRVLFSPDSRRLATTSDDGTARLYVMDVNELIKLARSRVTRSLTPQECRQYLHKEHCTLAGQ
jgi:WD40 repeat protein